MAGADKCFREDNRNFAISFPQHALTQTPRFPCSPRQTEDVLGMVVTNDFALAGE
jgi:hypothetical protein